MTENKNTISYEELINKMNEKNASTKTIKALGENIEVKTVLSMSEFDDIFTRIIGLLYTDEEYNSAARDFVIRLCTVLAYTNVPFPKEIDDELMRNLYELMYGTDFYDSVVKVVDDAQYSSLLNAVSEEIRYRNNNRISRVNRQIEQMSAVIENIGEQFKEMLSDVSEEDINNVLSAIQNGTIDEGKLVKAYTESKGGDE